MSNDQDHKLLEIVLNEWKTAIGVQEHFNTIEMQIRNLAVTVLTAIIGAAVLVYTTTRGQAEDAAASSATPASLPSLSLLGVTFSPEDLVIAAGLIAWLAFYLMDRWWYHRLLQGAVKHAQYVENQLKNVQELAPFLGDGLSNSIRIASPFRLFGLVEVHSDKKIDLFYLVVAAVLIVMMLFLF